MLPRNILVVSLIVFLVSTTSTAPVEEKEREEVEVEAAEEGEEELSEEEEDDDDSKSQDEILGVGVHHATTVSRGLGISAAPGVSSQGPDPKSTSPSAAVGSNSGAAAGSQDTVKGGQTGSSVGSSSTGGGGQGSSATSQIQAGGSPGAVGGVSGQTQAAAGESPAADSTSQSEPSGNGQKLLNGGADNGHTGVLEPLVGEAAHLDYTGIIDQSSHDFLIGLMGGVDPFGPDVHIDVTDHTALSAQLDPTVMSSDPVAALDPAMSSSSLSLDLTSEHHLDLSIDQSGLDHTSLSSGSDQSSSSSVSGSSHSSGQGVAAADSPSSKTDANIHHPDGVDSADTNGNGRQNVLTDTNGGGRPPVADVSGVTLDLTGPHPGFSVEVSHIAEVTDGVVSLNDLQTHSLQSDLTGGAESVTDLHIDLTASGLGLGHDVTGDPSSPVLLHTETPDHSSFTHTLHSVPGEYSQTDMVTTATDMSTDTVTADPPATVLDSSHPTVTEHTRMAGSATEQYNPSGEGPQGAENVELEDTC